jgi:hypothetical protein
MPPLGEVNLLGSEEALGNAFILEINAASPEALVHIVYDIPSIEHFPSRSCQPSATPHPASSINCMQPQPSFCPPSSPRHIKSLTARALGTSREWMIRSVLFSQLLYASKTSPVEGDLHRRVRRPILRRGMFFWASR